jgi:hypothetical protein
MKYYNVDLENVDFADEMIRAIEKDYGRTIVRIPKFNKRSATSFDITIVFTDFRILEAVISIEEINYLPTLVIQGCYF